MLTLIEALRYRCLRDVRTPLTEFQVLVGPNASGKSTFLDVLGLISDALEEGVEDAVWERSPDPKTLVWMEEADYFELAVELTIPEEKQERLGNAYQEARYEIGIGLDEKGQLGIHGETLWLKPHRTRRHEEQRTLFPEPRRPRERLVHQEGRRSPEGWKKVLAKHPTSGNDYFFAETTKWQNPFRLGPKKLALANLPEDEERFPVATWVKRVLMEGVVTLFLDSEEMREPSPPGSPIEFEPDGSNLPWVVQRLKEERPGVFADWLDHVRTALPDVSSIDVVVRPEDRKAYLLVSHASGLRAPSWMLSDGTLRLLALTLLAYIDEPGVIYLIEEPENGIHPQAVETVFQALTSTRRSQILCATHSPVVLAQADLNQVLCFAKDAEGATDIARGSEHPYLKDWKRDSDLGTLFAAGVLG